MSSITAVLLMYLNEEDAFWALVVLIGSPKFAMHGMLIPGLPKLLAYCDFHAAMRKRLIPKIDKHLVRLVGPRTYHKFGPCLFEADGTLTNEILLPKVCLATMATNQGEQLTI